MSTSTTYPNPPTGPAPVPKQRNPVIVSRVVERHGYRIEVRADLNPAATSVDLKHDTKHPHPSDRRVFRWHGVVFHDDWAFSEGLPVVRLVGVNGRPTETEFASLDAFIDGFVGDVRDVLEEDQQQRDVVRERVLSGYAVLDSLTGVVIP